MKLGFVLTSNPNMPHMDRSLRSLAKTDIDALTEFYKGQNKPQRLKPVLFIVHSGSKSSYDYYALELGNNWNVWLFDDIPGIVGVNKMFSYWGDKLIDTMDVTHIGFLVDDFIYNPAWLQQLTLLIKRHPDAKAWSVYRSRYTRHHRILHTDENGDVLMTMHDCVGTMTREEWEEYDASSIGDFSCPPEMGGGCTIDIHHAYARPGDRWATGRDYMQNLGLHRGIENVDCAIDFVGEGA